MTEILPRVDWLILSVHSEQTVCPALFVLENVGYPNQKDPKLLTECPGNGGKMHCTTFGHGTKIPPAFCSFPTENKRGEQFFIKRKSCTYSATIFSVPLIYSKEIVSNRQTSENLEEALGLVPNWSFKDLKSTRIASRDKRRKALHLTEWIFYFLRS